MLSGKLANSNKRLNGKSRTYYQSRKYTNPFFQNTKKGRNLLVSKSNKVKIIMLFGMFVFCSLIWLFIYSEYFTISATEIKGEGRIDPALIEKIVWEQINSSYFILLPQKNIFLFNKNNLKNALENKFSFNSLAIEKKIPNKLIIRFNEKEYALIWQEGDAYYYGDNQGYVITELPNALEVNKKDYPLIQNQKIKKLEDNLADIETPYIDYVLRLFKEFNANAELPLDYFIIDDEQNTIKIKLLNGPKLYFNINESVEKQINKILIIKNEKLKNDFFKKEYIDVRIGDSVYFR